LAPYVPRIAGEWERDAPDQAWRCVDGTLVFVDISGFTALSERLARRGRIGAEELTDMLGRCFAELLSVAYHESGSLLKFGGDALLLLFDGAEHAERASRAALRMRTRMQGFGRLTSSVGAVRLRMSVGIHSGDLHLFRVGRSHKECIITGPGATQTVAMEGIAEAGEIVVSDATAAALPPALLGGRKGAGWLLKDRRTEANGAPTIWPVRDTAGGSESVPVALREHLLAGAAESEHRRVAVAFVHFDGTDDLLISQGPDALAAALAELIEDVQDAADAQHVTFLATDIDRDGGKVILVAGAPRTMGDEEGRLLRAVRQIADRTHALPVRIGVHDGHVFAGEVGPPYRRTYTVMGDAVNLAARLMAAAAPGQILATRDALDRSRTEFALTAVPPFTVKGKAEPVTAFVVGAAQRSRADAIDTTLPLTGREREYASLLDGLARAWEGAGTVVELVGDVGVGKTRLVDELCRRATGASVWHVRCEQYERTTPFSAARQLVASVLGLPGDQRLAGPRLLAAVRDRAPELVGVAPLLGDVLGVVVAETDETASLAPRWRRERTNLAVVKLLAPLLPSAAVFAVDDTHWMDDASASVFSQLTTTIGRRPWLLCTTRRTDEHGGFHAGTAVGPDGSAMRIDVGALSPEASDALVALATEHEPLPPHERESLVQRAGGNPLYLEELLRVQGRGEELPRSLEAVVAADIDSLAPTDRRLLRYAAVLGMSVDVDVLSEIAGAELGVSVPVVMRRLAAFLPPDGRHRVRFRHRLLRDVAYEMLPFRRREELHGRAGDAIEHAAGGADDPDARGHAEVLALHFLHAKRYDKAWRYARIAGERAEGKYANLEAGEHYERAVLAARRLPEVERTEFADVFERMGKVRTLLGIYQEAADAYGHAQRLLRDDPIAIARLCRRRAVIAERQGKPSAAARWTTKGLRALEGRADAEALRAGAELAVRRAWEQSQRGHHRASIRWCERALDAAEQSGARDSMADALAALDLAYIAIGTPERATHGDEAIAIYEELNDFASQAVLLNNLGAAAYFQGRWAEARARYDRARAAFERIGDTVDAGVCACNMAEILADQGLLDTAEAALQEVLKLWRSHGFRLGIAMATRYLGRVSLKRGDVPDALTRFETARGVFEEYGMATTVVEVDAWIAECLLRDRAIADASKLLDDVLAREAAMGGTDMRAMLHRLRAYAAMAGDDLVGAWAEVDASLAIARNRRAAYDVALALEALAVVTYLGGQPIDEGTEAERRRLLDQLGVDALPPPPV
jgi:predicted ATPase/GGDEF domain-containing protein